MSAVLPNRIKELRDAQGLYLREVAKVLNVSLRTINRWELGEVQIPDEKKVRLAAVFGVTVAFLMKWDS